MQEDGLAVLLSEGTTARPRPLFPGAVIALDLRGEQRTWSTGVTRAYADAAGTPLPAAACPPVREDTLYDLASLTKLVTATVVVLLADRGLMDLDEPVRRYLPGFDGDGRDRVSVRHLLTHTSGLPAETFTWRRPVDAAARRREVLDEPVLAPPGTQFRYSCVGYLLLGLLVERVAGPLDVVVEQEVVRPLGLADLGFRPLDRGVPVERIAAAEVRPVTWSSLVDPEETDTRGVVHDEKAAAWDGVAGNAGLFGTAADVRGLGRALLDLLQGRDSPLALSPGAARAMVTPGLAPGADFGMGLGWRIDDASFMGTLAGRGRSYGHTGFTGTSLVVDEDRDLVAVLLTNRVHPSRKWSELQPFRREVAAFLSRL